MTDICMHVMDSLFLAYFFFLTVGQLQPAALDDAIQVHMFTVIVMTNPEWSGLESHV